MCVICNACAGRKEPNLYPVLEEPDRLKFSLNPFFMFKQLLGPKLCNKVTKIAVFVILIGICYLMIPLVASDVFANVLPEDGKCNTNGTPPVMMLENTNRSSTRVSLNKIPVLLCLGIVGVTTLNIRVN